MTALNDAERAAIRRDAEGGANRALSDDTWNTRQLEQTGRYPAWLPSRRFIAAVIAIGGMQLLATMDSTVAIVALPKIQDELSLSDAGRSWVITAYVLTFGGLMLLGGRLGDTIGRKRTFIVGVALFTIASILCGIAWDEATLVTARLLQGVGAAIASPTGLALIATTFPKGPARNAATAVFAAMTGVGSVMGLVVGGALTEVSWRLGVPGERADRAADDPPGPQDAAGDPSRAAEAGRHGRRPGHARLHRRGVRLLDGPRDRAGSRRSRSVRAWPAWPLPARVPLRRAHRRKPRRAVRPVQGPQPGGHVRGRLPGRRRDVHADRADRPVRAGHHGLQRITRRRRLHPVRHRARHRPRSVVAPGVAVPAAGAGDRRRRAGAGRDALRLDAQRRHPVLPEPGAADHRRRLRYRHDRRPADRVGDRRCRLRPDRARCPRSR